MSFGFLRDVDCPATSNATWVYTSPRYLEPSWDKCHTCYSDPVKQSFCGRPFAHVRTYWQTAWIFGAA